MTTKDAPADRSTAVDPSPDSLTRVIFSCVLRPSPTTSALPLATQALFDPGPALGQDLAAHRLAQRLQVGLGGLRRGRGAHARLDHHLTHFDCHRTRAFGTRPRS